MRVFLGVYESNSVASQVTSLDRSLVSTQVKKWFERICNGCTE